MITAEPVVNQTEGTLSSWDDAQLFWRAWEPVERKLSHAIILLHRGHEHSSRLQRLIDELDMPDIPFYAYDMRGHGHSEGERGYADNYDVWIRDLDAFVHWVKKRTGLKDQNLAIIGNSVGAVTACAWIHTYGAKIGSLVLAAPAFRIRLYVPFAIPGLRFLHAIRPRSFVKSYVRSSMLTHDIGEAKAYDSDPLITRNIAVSVLLGLHDRGRQLVEYASEITTPIMLLSAGKDYVVDTRSQKQFFEHLGSETKAWHDYPDCFHALLYESNANQILAKARHFIEQSFANAPTVAANTAQSHQNYQNLLHKPSLAAKASALAQQLMLKTVGRLSKGIQTGWKTGFDSGPSLQYVYENKATGITPLGKLIDRIYLNAPGWQGVRQRKKHLDDLLLEAVRQSIKDFGEVIIFDPAIGSGKYLLDLLQLLPQDRIAAIVHDLSEDNINALNKLIAEKQLPLQARVANAFDPNSYQHLHSAPTVVVVSGLYELFPDNDLVTASLSALCRCMRPGGQLIYTGQPWHPQQNMIGRVLINSRGKPWIMRCRPQQELDDLVGEAGFEKLSTRATNQGIFTVSVARKRIYL